MHMQYGVRLVNNSKKLHSKIKRQLLILIKITLAKTWGIEGLPTLLILDQNGKIIANHIGYVDGAGLLEFAKEASGQ
jgi:thioredoxin-related protein